MSQSKQIVLIGAGHGHLHVARHAERFLQAGAEVILVDPDVFWYSGLATGVLGGMYDAELDQVDPRSLVEAHGGRFLQDRAIELDRERRIVYLASGRELRYDCLSFNVGSEVPLERVPGAQEHAWGVKPVSNLAQLRQRLEKRLAGRSDDGPLRAVVVGSGPTGSEVAANIDALARRKSRALQLTLLSRSQRLLAAYPAGAGRALARVFDERGVEVVLGQAVERVERGGVETGDGRWLGCDVLVMATGLRPNRLVSRLGLAVDKEGALRVDASLRSLDDPQIFGIGDCIRLEGYDLPRLGVFGVRASPILLHNLLAAARGKALQSYRPQKRYLIILNLGCDDGLAIWGRLYWHGRASLWLKDRIDRRFLHRYRAAS